MIYIDESKAIRNTRLTGTGECDDSGFRKGSGKSI